MVHSTTEWPPPIASSIERVEKVARERRNVVLVDVPRSLSTGEAFVDIVVDLSSKALIH
jgi:hypothetical protein